MPTTRGETTCPADANKPQPGAPVLFLLGEPRVRTAQGKVHLLERHDAAMLASLVLQGPQARSAVALVLWPDSTPAAGLTNLRQRLYRLRRAVGPLVQGQGPTLQLNSAVTHDLDPEAWGLPSSTFELLAACHFAANEALAEQVQELRQQWVQLRTQALESRSETLESAGRFDDALVPAQQLLVAQPQSEHAFRRCIRLHYLRNDRAAALAAFERCEAMLQEGFGLRPDSETRGLLALLNHGHAPHHKSAGKIPASLLRPPTLVGRNVAWAAVADGLSKDRAVLLEGEAGMGKSRLLGDFAASQTNWSVVGAAPGDQTLPLALVARMLQVCTQRWGLPRQAWVTQEIARLVPVAGPAPTDPFEPLRLQQAVRQALEDWHLAGLAGIGLDDLHYADNSSLDLLLPLLGSSGPAWIIASRPPALPAAAERCATVHLQPWDLPALRNLLQVLNLPDFPPDPSAALLLQRTGGNPLYVLQTLAAALEAGTSLAQAAGESGGTSLPVPMSLRRLLTERLHRLEPLARSVVRVAAVAGADFNLAMACAVLAQQPADLAEPWLELQAAQVMGERDFAHDLIRDAAVEITPLEVARLLHAQVAGWMAQHGGTGSHVAEHWDAAGCWAEAAAAYEQASHLARERSAVEDEYGWLMAAARCHHTRGTAQGEAAAFDAELLALELSVSQTRLHQDTQQACEALLTRATETEQESRALILLAHYWAEKYEPERALQPATRALTLAQGQGHTRNALMAVQRVCGALMRLGRNEEALAKVQPWVTQSTVLNRDERLNWLADYANILDYADQRVACVEVLDTVSAEALLAGRWTIAASALLQQSSALGYLGCTRTSLKLLEQSLALSRHAGAVEDGLLIERANHAGLLRDLGRFKAYLPLAEALPQALRRAGNPFWAANCEHDLAVAFAWLGRPDLALRTLSSPNEDLHPTMQAARLTTRARLARDYGVGKPSARPDQLLEQALQLLDQGAVMGHSMFRLSIQLQAARDLEPHQAVAAAAKIEAEGLARQNMMLAGTAALVQMRQLRALGELSAAGRVAHAMHKRMDKHLQVAWPPAGFYPPELWLELGRCLQAEAPDLAAQTLAMAAEWVRKIAATHVPEIFRESFVRRNPYNAELLAADPGLTPS